MVSFYREKLRNGSGRKAEKREPNCASLISLPSNSRVRVPLALVTHSKNMRFSPSCATKFGWAPSPRSPTNTNHIASYLRFVGVAIVARDVICAGTAPTISRRRSSTTDTEEASCGLFLSSLD